MIAGIASLIFIPLLAVSMAHFMWAFGSTWPAGDEKLLARAVTGFKGAEKMPPRLLTALVALLTLTAGVWVLLMSEKDGNTVLTAGGALIGLVFLIRGVAGYAPQWRTRMPEEPFARLDRKFYSPLCLALAAGFAFLVYWRLT